MSDNDLVLSNDELNGLMVYYHDDCLPKYHADKEDDLWYGIQIGDRMFDLNIWLDDLTEEIICTVYECDWLDGNWTTNCRRWWTI